MRGDPKRMVSVRLETDVEAKIPHEGRQAFLETIINQAVKGGVGEYVTKEAFMEWVNRAEKLALIVSRSGSPAQRYMADGVLREGKALNNGTQILKEKEDANVSTNSI